MSMMAKSKVNDWTQYEQIGRAVRITPEMAKELLDAQPMNRKVRPMMVDQLARAFDRGEAICHPSMPIMLDQFGRLVEGQHRCLAIIKHGQAVTLWVMTVDKPVVTAYHNSLPRTLADSLSIDFSIANSNCVATVARMVKARIDGTLYSSFPIAGTRVRLTPRELLDVYDQFGVNWEDVSRVACRLTNNSLVPVSKAQVGYLLFQLPEIEEWLNCLLTDDGTKTPSQFAARKALTGTPKAKYAKVVIMTKAYNNPQLTKFHLENKVPDLIGGKFEDLD